MSGPAVYRGFPQTLVVGRGSVGVLASELETAGVRRVAVLTSPSVAAGATFARVMEQLSAVEVVNTFTAVRPHALIEDTEPLAADLSQVAPQALVAVGGGSVSDTAKACAILLAEGGQLEDHCSTFTPPDQLHAPILPGRKAPVLAIPTTLSGAEMTPGGGATNAQGIKRVFWDPKVAVSHAIFDPEVLAETPESLLVTTAMNGLAHCAEGLYSRTRNPVSTALALRGASLFAFGLIELGRSGATEETLLALAEAAALGGMVISHARVGLHHAICHVLGAQCGLHHGVANSVMLPYVLDFNGPDTVNEQSLLAVALSEGIARAGVELDQRADGYGAPELVALVGSFAGAPRSLQETGLAIDMLEPVSRGTMQDRGLYFNPRKVQNVGEVLGILERAWDGAADRV